MSEKKKKKGTEAKKACTSKKKDKKAKIEGTPKRKLSDKQTVALRKGQELMAAALEKQKKGGTRTVTKTVYKKSLQSILKKMSKNK